MRFFERIQQPCFDCFGVGTAVAGGFNMVGQITAADKQASAARDAAKLAADAATHGADLQDEASKRTEQFNREQAEALWQATEQSQHANYNQWAAKRQYQGSLGKMLGLGSSDIPDYVPSVDPRFTAGGPGAVPPPTSASPVQVGVGQTPLAAARAPMGFGALIAGGATLAPGAMAMANSMPPTDAPGDAQLDELRRRMGGNAGPYGSFGDYLGAA